MWLAGEYFQTEGKGIGSRTIQDTLNTLEAIAIFQGETRSVYLRTAEHQASQMIFVEWQLGLDLVPAL
jgi:hypothetical protein